jgi:hypothetical protein
MTDLKLIALDAEDLAVVSAHLQDAVLRVSDLAYLKREKRFAAIVNRFDWVGPMGEARKGAKGTAKHQRRRSGLRFERVLGAQTSGFDVKAKDAVLNLLAIGFEPTSEPEGYVTLLFSGDAAIRLHVECIEAELKDLGAAWRARAKPKHPGEEPPAGG